MEKIKWAVNTMPKTADSNLKVMGLDEVRKARTFHESFPQYSVTPLAKLDHMAARLGLKEVYVKDESYRFGLNAFKVLGGSFAMARYIAKQTGKDVSELPVQLDHSHCIRMKDLLDLLTDRFKQDDKSGHLDSAAGRSGTGAYEHDQQQHRLGQLGP